VLVFPAPNFHGQVGASWNSSARETIHVIDALTVRKDDNGEMDVVHLSNLTDEEAIELGTKVAAPIVLVIEGEQGVAIGADGGHRGRAGLLRRRRVGRARGHLQRHCRGDGFVRPLDLIGIGLVGGIDAQQAPRDGDTSSRDGRG
jgi:hypothetical protein